MATLKYVGRSPATDRALMSQRHIDDRFAETSIDQQALDDLVVPRTADLVLPAYVRDQDALLARKDYVDTQDAKYQLRSSLGAANGIASLDSTGKIPAAQLAALADFAPGHTVVSASISGMVSTTGARTLASFTIPDPGYAYTPWIFGHVLAKSDGNWSMPRIDVLNASSARVAMGFGTEAQNWNAIKVLPCPPHDSAMGMIYTGATTYSVFGYHNSGTPAVSFTNTGWSLYAVAMPAYGP